jgi:phage-related protein
VWPPWVGRRLHSCAGIQKLVWWFLAMRPLFWVGSTLQDLRAFPGDARRIAGHELHLVQKGLEPDDWRSWETTTQRDLELARERYREVLRQRQGPKPSRR